MKKGTKNLVLIAIGLPIALSLFVSSVAACICSHHTPTTPKREFSACHGHSETKQRDDSGEKSAKLDANDDCNCLQPTPRVFSKSETIKIEKQAVALPVSGVEFTAVCAVSTFENAYYEKPFYLSDSFYNLKSPRAPPVL